MEELGVKGSFRLKYGIFPEEMRTFHDQYRTMLKTRMEKLIKTALEILLDEETFSMDGISPSQLTFVELVLQGFPLTFTKVNKLYVLIRKHVIRIFIDALM